MGTEYRGGDRQKGKSHGQIPPDLVKPNIQPPSESSKVGLRVVSDKDVAFAGYLRNVLNLERWPWTRRGPLKDVPDELVRRASEYTMPEGVTYEKHPLQDLKGGSAGFRELAREVEGFHDREWEKYHERLGWTAATAQSIVQSQGPFIAGAIQETTGVNWPCEEVWLVPSISLGGSVVGNKVFLGFTKSGTRDGLSRLSVHELIHVNTREANDVYRALSALNLYSDSKEITTVLLTNKVLDSLNDSYGLGIRHQRFHGHYAGQVREYADDLAELSRKHGSYRDLIYAVDGYLTQKGYQGYYEKHKKD